MSALPKTEPSGNPFESADHRAWLARHREALLDFYQPEVCLPTGGYAWLDDAGHPIPAKGAQLWLGSRMIHVFSLAAMLGRSGAAEVVSHGLEFYLAGPGHDDEFGAWYPVVGGENPQDRKELYGIAQMLLAGASASTAGIPGGAELMAEAEQIIDRYYWLEDWGRCAEAYDRTFSDLDPYRGQNANMHLAEAYLAAHQVSGNPMHLRRATRIAYHIAGIAARGTAPGGHRLPEHFDTEWNPILDYNRDDPRHPFRPFGSQIGHWLEWSKLCSQIAAQGVAEPWLQQTAEILFDASVQEGWLGEGGFVYTVDWQGRPVVEERYFWEPPEAMGAARMLWLATGKDHYLQWYRRLWQYCEKNFLDHDRGGWFSELDRDSQPVTYTWEGKPDLYHVYQATLYALVPAELGLATWAAQQSKQG